MYSLFINDVLIESSKDFDILLEQRYSKILELLEDGYQYADDKDNYHYNNNAEIELLKANDTKKLSIYWSGNTVDDIYDAYNTNDTNDMDDMNADNTDNINDADNTDNINDADNTDDINDTDNIEENADTIKDQNKNNGITLEDSNNTEDLNDIENSNNTDEIYINDSNSINADTGTDTDILKKEQSNNSINDSQQEDINTKNTNTIKNNIINAIVSALNTLEYDSAFIPSKTLAQQIQTLFNDQEYISYNQQFLTSILAGKSEHEMIIPIKQNDDLVSIYTLCYVLIVRGYQFNLNVDDKYQLHIKITW